MLRVAIICCLGFGTASMATAQYFNFRNIAQDYALGVSRTVAEGTATINSDSGKLRNVSMRVMPDQSVSWEQPDDSRTYNGRCGETSAANIVSMIYRKTSPIAVSKNMIDATPGTLPKTLSKYLNDFAPGKWTARRSSHANAISSLREALSDGELKAANGNAPVAVLLQVGATSLHWVTVVDVEADDTVVFNQYGFQQRKSSEDFLKSWGFRSVPDPSGFAVRQTLRQICCSPYTYVAQ